MNCVELQQNFVILRIHLNQSITHTESYILNDPELQDKVPTSYLSHKEVYENSIRKVAILLRKLKTFQDEGMGGLELYRYSG